MRFHRVMFPTGTGLISTAATPLLIDNGVYASTVDSGRPGYANLIRTDNNFLVLTEWGEEGAFGLW